MYISKGLVFSVLAIFGFGFYFSACNQKEDFKRFNTTAENVAVKGFDTVAYFTMNSAVSGNPQHSLLWNGVNWYFSSAENMEKFKAEPEKYAPQFGGYCSFAVSKGYTADGDPNAWKIVNGKLYLNYNPKVKEMWEAEQEKRIADGEKNWAEFKNTKPEYKN